MLRSLGWHTVALWFRTARGRDDPSPLAHHADEVVAAGARAEVLPRARRARQRLASLGHAVVGSAADTYPYAARYDAVDGRSRMADAIRKYRASAVLLPTFLAHWAPTARGGGATVIGDSYDVQSKYARELFRAYAPHAPWRGPGLGVNVLASWSQERLFLPMCQEIWVTTPLEVDQVKRIAANTNVLVLGSGLDEAAQPQLPAPPDPIVGFIGNYSYGPNIDAVQTLGFKVWPAVHARRPDAILRLAGDGIPVQLKRELNSVPGVEVLGRVVDARAFVSECHVLALPIRTRGGLPLKLVEGLASGRPVVATPELVHGTELAAGRDLLVGTTTADIASAVVRLLDDPAAAAEIGAAGRLAFELHYSLGAMKRRAQSGSVLAGGSGSARRQGGKAQSPGREVGSNE